MLPDRVSNPGPLTFESGALPIALCGPAFSTGFSHTRTMGRTENGRLGSCLRLKNKSPLQAGSSPGPLAHILYDIYGLHI